MQTARLPARWTVLAPDGSEIRELVAVDSGSMVHCTLPPAAASMAVAHATVEEVWYFLQGTGQLWRSRDGAESVVDVEAGMAVTIERGTHFQFRNTGNSDLCFVIVTMPPWPGEPEARRVDDHWTV